MNSKASSQPVTLAIYGYFLSCRERINRGAGRRPPPFYYEESMNQYITYTCKNCKKQYKILLQWGDLKPRRCTGKRCKTNFAKDPTKLEVKVPKKPAVPAPPPKKTPNKNKKRKKKS